MAKPVETDNTPAAWFIARALLLAAAALPWSEPVRADRAFSGSCVASGSGAVCAGALRRGAPNTHVIHLRSAPPDEEEVAARDRAWEQRCRPSLVYDRNGVGRYVYAARGCELGRSRD